MIILEKGQTTLKDIWRIFVTKQKEKSAWARKCSGHSKTHEYHMASIEVLGYNVKIAWKSYWKKEKKKKEGRSSILNNSKTLELEKNNNHETGFGTETI